MKSSHILDHPTWLESTPSLDALDEKTLLLLDPDGRRISLKLHVSPADPNGLYRGKVSVKVCRTWTDDIKFVNVTSGLQTPTSKIHARVEYLDAFAISQIRKASDKEYLIYDYVLKLDGTQTPRVL